MSLIQRFSLNIVPNSAPVIVHVNQYDVGSGRLVISLYNGSMLYTPASGATALIEGTKPDKRGYSYPATIRDGSIIADLTDQMTVVPGKSRVNVILHEGNNRTGTFVFYLDVQATGLADDVDTSSSELAPYLDGAQSAARSAEASATTASEAASTATAAAASIGDNVQRAETAATNASTSATTASTAATSASTSATSASGSATAAAASATAAAQSAAEAEQYAQGGLSFKSSVTFANIPTSGMRVGDMYNITTDFTTDSRFEEGSGIAVKAGTNIAWNTNSKWDLLAVGGAGSNSSYKWLEGGTEITSSNSNLNNYTQVGNYYKADTSFSCSNSPLSGNSSMFRMTVSKVNDELYTQAIYSTNNSGAKYMERYYIFLDDTQEWTWGQWVILAYRNGYLSQFSTVTFSSMAANQVLKSTDAQGHIQNSYLSSCAYDSSNTLADVIGNVETLLASL